MNKSITLPLLGLTMFLSSSPTTAQLDKLKTFVKADQEELKQFGIDPREEIKKLLDEMKTEIDGSLNEYQTKLDDQIQNYETKMDGQINLVNDKLDKTIATAEAKMDGTLLRLEEEVQDIKGELLGTIGTVAWRFTLTDIITSVIATFLTAFFTAFLTARKIAVDQFKKELNQAMEESRRVTDELNANVREIKDLVQSMPRPSGKHNT